MLLNLLSSACIVQAAHASSLYVNTAISLVVAQWKSTRLGSKTPEVVGSMPVVYWSFVFFFHLPLSNKTVQCPSKRCMFYSKIALGQGGEPGIFCVLFILCHKQRL